MLAIMYSSNDHVPLRIMVMLCGDDYDDDGDDDDDDGE